MKHIFTFLLSFVLTAASVIAETKSVTLSLNTLTVDTPTVLVKSGETYTMNCRFTANVSMGLPTLQSTLNNQLAAAGITTLEITNLRAYSLSSPAIYMLTLNFSPLGNVTTRIFNITTLSRTQEITLIGDSDGVLDTYDLIGTWAEEVSDTFSLKLSDSQPGVTYTLQKDGINLRSSIGTGGPLSYGTFSGASSHGDYSVLARYNGWEDQIVGTVRMVRRYDIGGNNYTAVRTYTKDDGSEFYTDVVYYNKLGYPEQEINIEGASDNRDLIKPIVYDNMMRPNTKEYLPFPSSFDTGMYIDDVLIAHQDFYYNEERPYIENIFESGVSGRMLTSQKPGVIYRDDNKMASMEYGINDVSEEVMEFKYDYAGSNGTASVTKSGYYGSERLLYTKVVSENNDISYVFSDNSGKTILRREVSDDINYDTYFIYDLKDSLVCVIQPEGTSRVSDSFALNSTFCNNYCFTYRYDERGNIIEKQIPGAGKEVMAYDMRNRMVLFADAEMQLSGKCKYIYYDSLDRVTEEGYASLNTSIENVRNAQRNNTPISNYLANKMITRTVTYYTSSNNPILSIPSNSRAYRQGVDFTRCLTLPAIEYIYEEPFLNGTTLSRGNLIRTKTYFYDSKGRLTLMTESDSDGWKSIYSWQNDFAGNIIKHTEEHYKGNVFDSMISTYTYDKRGQRLTMQRNLNGKDYAPVTYDYDDYGRVRVKDVGDRGTEVYGYNLQGWQESIAAYFYGYDVFSQTMNYQIPYMDTSEPRYDGMISEVRHRHLNKDIQTVNYKYDGVRRLVDSEHFVNWDSTACNLWTESSIVYDLNGNIQNLSRKRESDDEDIIAVTHSGNRMTGSRINGGTTNTYSYYSDGNLKQDNRRNLQFVYNLLNLPSVVTDASGQVIKARYSYLADGTKLSVRDAQNDGLNYRGSFVYTVDGTAGSTAATEKLESIVHDEGRFLALSASAGATTTQFIDTWHIRDHLGSIRTVLDITRDTSEVSDPTIAILEQNDYLPFGMRIDIDSLAYDQSNRYRFNGKEEQVTGNIGLTDYGARFYDSTLPRWTTPDPLAEKYYGISPYAFCNNNPVNFVDWDGMDWIKCAETGNYEWRDDIYNDSEIPEGYTYVGSSTDDILKDLNINSQYNMNELSIISIGGDCDEVNPNKSSWRLLVPINIEVTASVKVSPIISFIPANSTGNNLLGKSFTGIKFTAVMTQRQANSINDFDNEAIARFYINYGPKVFNQQLESPKEAYVVPSGTKITSGTIFISASALSPNRSFGNATLGISAQNFGLYSQTKSIQWKISRYY